VDGEIVVLCSSAATTLVTLMTTDGWKQVKVRFAALWQRGRPEQAAAVEADLESARDAAITARREDDEEALADIAAEWRSRLRQLTNSDEALQIELRRLVEELRPLLADGSQAGSTVMNAHGSGSSQIYQAGRDQTITGS
jgi:hypothetical protein